MTVYERGHEDEPAYVRYLASIGQTARECPMVGDTLTIKVGDRRPRRRRAERVGRRTSRCRSGSPSTKQFGGTRRSIRELFKMPVEPHRADLRRRTSTRSFDQVVVTAGPDDRDLIIYVGFDEGPESVASASPAVD